MYHTLDNQNSVNSAFEANLSKNEPTVLYDPEKGEVEFYHDCAQTPEYFVPTAQPPPH